VEAANLDSKSGDKKLRANQGAWPSVQVSTFRTWEEVGRWYGDLQKPEVAVTPAIRAKATEFDGPVLTGDDEKIRALYAFSPPRIHYCRALVRHRALPATLRPRRCSTTEYGDCKDKHTIAGSAASRPPGTMLGRP